jgi:hypothetical protein
MICNHVTYFGLTPFEANSAIVAEHEASASEAAVKKAAQQQVQAQVQSAIRVAPDGK